MAVHRTPSYFLIYKNLKYFYERNTFLRANSSLLGGKVLVENLSYNTGAGGYIEFLHNPFDMVFYCVFSDIHMGRNLLVCLSLQEETHDGLLAFRQISRLHKLIDPNTLGHLFDQYHDVHCISVAPFLL